MVPAILAVWYVLGLPVVVEVAALAQVAEVVVWVVGIGWVVVVVVPIPIHVGRGKHYHAAGVRVWLAVGGSAVGVPGRAFAAVA